MYMRDPSELGKIENPPKKRRQIENRSRGATRRDVYTGRLCVYTRAATVDRGDPWSDGADRSEAINRYAKTGRERVCVCVCAQARRGLGGASVTVSRVFPPGRACVMSVPCVYVCERARVVRFDPHDCVRLVRGGVSAAILASRDSAAAAVARPTQTPPHRRPPAPSVPPRTGPVGGASSYIRRRRQSGTPLTLPPRPKIGGGCWFAALQGAG